MSFTTLDYLRRELQACEIRRRALEASIQHVEMCAKSERFEAGLHGVAASYRAHAFEMNEKAAAKWRGLIAKHIAHTAREASEPIVARSDDAALFELLADCGGIMPGKEN